MTEITAKNFDLSEGLKTHIQDKFSTLQRHAHNIISSEFVMEVDHPKNDDKQYVAEGHIKVKGETINAKACSEDMYQSIDKMMHKLDKQIIKHDEKRQAKQKAHAVEHHQFKM
jgi:putative sigma-54 modulation protein